MSLTFKSVAIILPILRAKGTVVIVYTNLPKICDTIGIGLGSNQKRKQ